MPHIAHSSWTESRPVENLSKLLPIEYVHSPLIDC